MSVKTFENTDKLLMYIILQICKWTSYIFSFFTNFQHQHASELRCHQFFCLRVDICVITKVLSKLLSICLVLLTSCHLTHLNIQFNSIQFNTKTLFKDRDPVRSSVSIHLWLGILIPFHQAFLLFIITIVSISQPQGDDGDIGPEGPKGPPGPFTGKNVTTFKGQRGDPGEKGDLGEQGIYGTSGKTGRDVSRMNTSLNDNFYVETL